MLSKIAKNSYHLNFKQTSVFTSNIQIPSKLKFDSENYATLYHDKNGLHDLQWTVRFSLGFTLLNAFLMITEYSNPIFGGWNQMAFTSCFMLGAGMMTALNIFSKRIVHELKLCSQGDKVQILFFNAFWKPEIIEVFVSEFANLEPSFQNYHRTELTQLGKIWINLERNYFCNMKEQQEYLLEVLSGQQINFGKMHIVAQKYKKYQTLK